MVSHRLGRHGSDRPSRPQLAKRDIQAGVILWLDKNANEHDLVLLQAAGLNKGALGHPVVVIDMLEKRPSHVKICMMTSCGNKIITTSKIAARGWSSYLPVQPTPSNPTAVTEPLRLMHDMPMRKRSYVNIRVQYDISLTLLEKYDRRKEILSHRLTPESLARLRAALSLPPPYSRVEHQPATEALHTTMPRPSPVQQSSSHQPEMPTGHIVVGIFTPSTPSVAERQPLLPDLPAARRPSTPSHLSVLPSSSPVHRNRNYGDSDPFRLRESPNTTLGWTILRTLLACAVLCIGVAFLAALGFSLFLGIAWFVRHCTALLTAVAADIVALGRDIAGVGHAVARPFVAVGRGVAAVGRDVGDLVGEIVHWIQKLKGQ